MANAIDACDQPISSWSGTSRTAGDARNPAEAKRTTNVVAKTTQA